METKSNEEEEEKKRKNVVIFLYEFHVAFGSCKMKPINCYPTEEFKRRHNILLHYTLHTRVQLS